MLITKQPSSVRRRANSSFVTLKSFSLRQQRARGRLIVRALTHACAGATAGKSSSAGRGAHEVGVQELGREASDGDDVAVGEPSCAHICEVLIAHLATPVCDSLGEADGGSASSSDRRARQQRQAPGPRGGL